MVGREPAAGLFITTGVQYAMQPFRGGFLVTDGHHNRVLRIDRNGTITPVVTLFHVVPTGLAMLARGASMLLDVERGPRGQIYTLSQGQWNGEREGSPALANTGRLVVVHRD